MKNIRIRTLLSISFILLCLLLIVVGGLGIYSLQQSNGNVVLLYQDRLVPIKLLGDINKNFLNIRGNILLMLYEQSSDQFEARNNKVAEWVQENKKNIDLYDKTAMAQEERTLWAVFKNALNEYNEKQSSLIKSIEERDFTLAMIRSNDFFAAQDSAAKAINDIIAYNQSTAEALQSDVESNFRKTLIFIFSIVGVSILLSVFLLFFVPRRINKPIDELVGAAKRVAKGDVNTNIHYHSNNEMGTLAASFAEVIKNLQNLVNQTKQLTDASSNGQFDVRADATAFEGGFKDILDGVNNTLDTVVEKAHWYESLLDSIPEFIMAIDSQMNLTFVNRAYATHKSSTREEMIGKPCNSINSVICANDDCAYKRLKNDVPQVTFENNGKYFINLASYLKDKNGDVIGHVELGRNVTQENRKLVYQKTEVNRLAKNLGLLAQGNLDLDLEVAQADEYTQEDYENFAKINNTFQAAKDSLQYYIGEIADKLERIAQGDINIEVTGEFKGEFQQIKDSLSKIVESLNEMLHQINQSSGQVLSGASQVASAAQSLSQGSTEQASSIEELSATIEDISGQIKKNAENSKNAKGLALSASDALDQAQKQMNNMVAAMVDINDSSQKISKIIKTIDEIAFQTNILALNAAVEAARAGEAGKGFAVVADEVRNLASKSAEAAKDTALLIENSIQAVEKGSQSANATAAKLVEVIAASAKSGELVSQISDATVEQSQAITQTTQGVTQISRVVQTNSATAEESAAASEELSGQANMLSQLISRFNLRSSSSGASHESFFTEPKKTSTAPRLDLPHDSKY